MTTSAKSETPATTAALATTTPAFAEAVARRGLDEFQWRTLTNSLFPGAKPESVLMVVDYCRARKLDPLKKPCHIVPMYVKDQRTGQGGTRDVVMPGIYELRTTAQRTGEYRGHTRPEFGDDVVFQGISVPAYCTLTVLRGPRGVDPDPFPVTIFFSECVGTDRDGKINERWKKAPRQMIEKCAEAAGLRKAFPDELGGEHTADEMEGRDTIDLVPLASTAIRSAQRLSEQAQAGQPGAQSALESSSAAAATVTTAETRQAAVSEPAADATAGAGAPKNSGTVKDVLPRGNGAMIVLSTGYRAATADSSMVKAATDHRDKVPPTVIELVCKPSSDPARFAPIVTEIIVIGSGETTLS